MNKLISLIFCLIISYNVYPHQIFSDLSDGNVIDYQFKYNFDKHQIEVHFRDCNTIGEDSNSKLYIVTDCKKIKTFSFEELNKKIEFYENELEELGPSSLLSFKILKETRNDLNKVRSVLFSQIATPKSFSEYLIAGTGGLIGLTGAFIFDTILHATVPHHKERGSGPFLFLTTSLGVFGTFLGICLTIDADPNEPVIESSLFELDEQIEEFFNNIKENIETSNIQQFQRKIIHLKKSNLNEIIGELNKN